MDKKEIINLLNTRDIRCISNSKDVIFVESIKPYINIDDKNYCDGINVILNSESIQDDISQLYCILECGCHKNLEDFYSENHAYDNSDIFYEEIKKIAEKPTNIIYYWYHHMMPSKDQENISNAIKQHDFETFIKYYKKYNSKGILDGYRETEEFNGFFPIVYLPNTASYFTSDNKHHTLDILLKDNFDRICEDDYECG